jgi:flagellar transcriptional activator FlhD
MSYRASSKPGIRRAQKRRNLPPVTRYSDCIVENIPNAQTEQEGDNDFKELNRKYLLLARELCRTDMDTAERMLGIPTRLGDKFVNLTLTQIDKLASSNMLVFNLRFRESNFWKVVPENVAPQTAELANIILTALSIERD